MSKKVIRSFYLSSEAINKLKILAKNLDRSRSWVVEDLIKHA